MILEWNSEGLWRKGKPREHCMNGCFFCRTWSHRLRPRKLHANVAVPPAPVRVPRQRSLAPSVSSVCRLMISVIRLYRGLCTDLLAFALQLRKTSSRRPSMKTVRPVKWGPLPPHEICRIAQNVRNGKGRNGWKKKKFKKKMPHIRRCRG